MKKKKDENAESTENTKKNKKVPIIIAIVALLVIIGSCNANESEDNSVSDSSTSSSESSIVEATDKSKEESAKETTTEEDTIASDIDISPEAFVSVVEEAIQGAVGSDEHITDVDLTDGKLTISVDLSEADTTIISLEDLTISRASSITDTILEFDQYDDLWNEIIIDFVDFGQVKKSKSEITENSYGRYFEITEIER